MSLFCRSPAPLAPLEGFQLLHLLLGELGRLLEQLPPDLLVTDQGEKPCGGLAKVEKGVRVGQGGITCGAIDEPRKSSKAIDERVIINFRDKNVVIARFRNKNVYQ